MSTLMDEISLVQALTDLGRSPAIMDAIKGSEQYRLWDRSTLEFFTCWTEMKNNILKKKLAKLEEHDDALAMDLQFDIDVALSRVQQPINVDVVMVMVQEFASTWSAVGGRFDDGTAMERAEELKQAIRGMLKVDTVKARDEN